MLANEAILDEVLDGLISDIKESQQAKGLPASYRSAKSLKRQTKKVRNGLKGSITGAAYFYQQQNGRLPGKFKKPPKALVDAIKEWVKKKGIDIPAYAVAFKINRDGIKVPNRYNSGGVLSEPLAPERVKQKLRPIIRFFYGNKIKSLILPQRGK